MAGKEHVEIFRWAKRKGFRATEELARGYCCQVFANPSRVLRIPLQGEEATVGVAALRRLTTVGGPKIFGVHRSTGSVLMERLRPGHKLKESASAAWTGSDVVAKYLRQFRHLSPVGLATIPRYYRDAPRVRSHPSFRALLESTPSECFLHGDLHHENVLQHADEWRPIDPKGLRGDPHYDLVPFVRNLSDHEVPQAEFSRWFRREVKRASWRADLDWRRVVRWSWLDSLDWRDSPLPYARVVWFLTEIDGWTREFD